MIELARYAVIIEKHYGRPMDIEWGEDGNDGKLYILQARPETVKSQEGHERLQKFKLKSFSKVLSSGRAIGQKIGVGPVRVVSDPKEMDETLDPANLFNVYEKGFKSQYVGTSTEGGVAVETIKLFPLDPSKKPFHTVILTVDKNKMEPRKVEMKYKDGNEVTYVLKNFRPNADMVEALFAFDKSKFPGVEVNDMR